MEVVVGLLKMKVVAEMLEMEVVVELPVIGMLVEMEELEMLIVLWLLDIEKHSRETHNKIHMLHLSENLEI